MLKLTMGKNRLARRAGGQSAYRHIARILVLLTPRLLSYVVAIYLIVIGVLGLAHHFNM